MNNLIFLTLAMSIYTSSGLAEEKKLEEPNGFNLLEDFKWNVVLRPRFEQADYAGQGSKVGKAITNRTNISVLANKTLGQLWLKSFLEIRSVNNFGYDNYSTVPPYMDDRNSYGRNNYGFISDPQQARITGAYFDLQFSDHDSLKMGRQTIELDDRRFIGGRNWRQMGQQFDAINSTYNYKDKYSAMLAYLFGEMSPSTQNVARDMSALLVHLKGDFADPLKLSLYSYLISNVRSNQEYKENLYEGSSTYGIRLSGNKNVNENFSLNYIAEGAMQKTPVLTYGSVDKSDLGELDAIYYRFLFDVYIHGFDIGVDYQSLGNASSESDRDGFHMPFSNLHMYQGFADVFLASTSGFNNGRNNKKGLTDFAYQLSYTCETWGKLALSYHFFNSIDNYEDSNGEETKDLGGEFDFQYTVKIPKLNNVSALVKGAFYTGGDVEEYSNDVTKYWVGFDYKFGS